MTPTLAGRLQTRVWLLLLVGVTWTLVHVPFLPLPESADLGDGYRVAFGALVLVMAAGLAWECLYHLVQQFRWEKDWPTGLGLVTGINEGLLVHWLVSRDVVWDLPDVTPGLFALTFASTWLLVWAAANGPLRIVLVRWRFRGGRWA